jgi:hypothetical protein
MRTIDFGTVRRENGRFAKTYTLAYEAKLPTGETVRIVRGLTASGVERIARAITAIDFDDDRLDNVIVTDRSGADVTFGFACFSADEWPTGTVEQQEIAMRLLTFVPPTAV